LTNFKSWCFLRAKVLFGSNINKVMDSDTARSLEIVPDKTRGALTGGRGIYHAGREPSL
jgi:hypothetical protein